MLASHHDKRENDGIRNFVVQTLFFWTIDRKISKNICYGIDSKDLVHHLTTATKFQIFAYSID